MDKNRISPLNLIVIVLGCLMVIAGFTGVVKLPAKPDTDFSTSLLPPGQMPDSQSAIPLATRTPFLPLFPTLTPIPVSTILPAVHESKPAEEAIDPAVPTRLQIPSIELDAPVVPVIYYLTEIDGVTYKQYQSLNYFAAGWHSDSARAGEIGNTVINGHNNAYGEVFASLADVQVGDSIDLQSDSRTFHYTVVNRIIFPDSYYMEFDKRVSNGRWVARSSDNRLTLVTCWPYETYTHRLVLVARQVSVN